MPRLFSRQGFALLAEHMLSSVLVFATFFLAVRHFAPAEYGQFTKAHTEISLFAVFLTMALDAVLFNKLAEVKDRGAILGTTLGMRGIGILVVLALALGLAIAAGQPPSEALPWLLLALAPIAINSLNLHAMVLWSDNLLARLSPARMGLQVLFTGVKIVGILMDIEFRDYLLLSGIEVMAVFALTTFYSRHKGYDIRLTWSSSLARSLFHDAKPLMLSAFIVTLFFKLDLYLVSVFMPPESLATYLVAHRIVEGYALAIAVLLNQYYIQLTRLSRAKQLAGLAHMQRVAYLMAAGVLIAHQWIVLPGLELFFDGRYEESLELSTLLTATLVLTAAGTVRGYLFVIEGLNRYHVHSALMGVGILAILAYPAIQAWGLKGAAGVLILGEFVALACSSLLIPALRPYAPLLLGIGVALKRA